MQFSDVFGEAYPLTGLDPTPTMRCHSSWSALRQAADQVADPGGEVQAAEAGRWGGWGVPRCAGQRAHCGDHRRRSRAIG